jgi:hypothetical protein
MSPDWKGRLLEYFCLGVPAYRLRFQVPLDLKTVQRWFRILRIAIYSHEMKEMKSLLARQAWPCDSNHSYRGRINTPGSNPGKQPFHA